MWADVMEYPAGVLGYPVVSGYSCSSMTYMNYILRKLKIEQFSLFQHNISIIVLFTVGSEHFGRCCWVILQVPWGILKCPGISYSSIICMNYKLLKREIKPTKLISN